MFKTLSAKAAASLDQELMSTGAFSIDQLMELAGLAVAQSIFLQYPPTPHDQVLVLVGPGNNGGDGLVAARHLKLWNYNPVVYFPKKPSKPLFHNLMVQLNDLEVKEILSLEEAKTMMTKSKVIVDGLFGFSFKPPIRSPFDELISYMAENTTKIAPIVSIDIPSGWDVDIGPLPETSDIKPTMLVSLTAPKPCSEHFQGVHFLGGRFINNKIAEKYGIKELVEKYRGNDMVVKL